MSDTRLNGIIRAWEAGKPAFTCFAKADKQSAIDLSESPYDGLVFEMEHNPWDMAALQDSLQYLLNRKQIHSAPRPWRPPSRRSCGCRPMAWR
jgi:4-hydroxy-2-oxoheptanedioate aldolase